MQSQIENSGTPQKNKVKLKIKTTLKWFDKNGERHFGKVLEVQPQSCRKCEEEGISNVILFDFEQHKKNQSGESKGSFLWNIDGTNHIHGEQYLAKEFDENGIRQYEIIPVTPKEKDKTNGKKPTGNNGYNYKPKQAGTGTGTGNIPKLIEKIDNLITAIVNNTSQLVTLSNVIKKHDELLNKLEYDRKKNGLGGGNKKTMVGLAEDNNNTPKEFTGFNTVQEEDEETEIESWE